MVVVHVSTMLRVIGLPMRGVLLAARMEGPIVGYPGSLDCHFASCESTRSDARDWGHTQHRTNLYLRHVSVVFAQELFKLYALSRSINGGNVW